MVAATLMLGANEPLAMKSAVAVEAGWPLAVQLVAAFQFPDETLPFQVDEAPNKAVLAPARNMTGRIRRRMAGEERKVSQADRSKPFCLKYMMKNPLDECYNV